MGDYLMGEWLKWIKEHAGLWTCALVILGVITVSSTSNRWALAQQDATQIARNTALKTKLDVEVKRLDGDIVDLKNIIRAVSVKIDKLDTKFDTKIDKAEKEIKDEIRLINELLIKVLTARGGAKIVVDTPTKKTK